MDPEASLKGTPRNQINTHVDCKFLHLWYRQCVLSGGVCERDNLEYYPPPHYVNGCFITIIIKWLSRLAAYTFSSCCAPYTIIICF
jgi:hypothetical protein